MRKTEEKERKTKKARKEEVMREVESTDTRKGEEGDRMRVREGTEIGLEKEIKVAKRGVEREGETSKIELAEEERDE